ncbi:MULTISPECIES: HAMP domain-containing sensor histidine kinase [Bacillus]|uniref:HAMP domain-containing sensor histidine kinase n=1 Tax=Bacillus TaxID=1386 RepID=UPI0011A86CAF|nr:HAMP domain-containing sensor histidine kinase [Bacillus safensis]MBG9816227.1 histidine kinase [Bacillus safensis]MDI0273926.1 ATP-binding protein [Bacillus safensis]UXO87612.1 ATP-binding protein [Bacillus safensis]WCL58126.1 ATP-binding protein [Bacillus safensis]
MKPLSIKKKVLFLILAVIGIVAASALALTFYLYQHLYIDKQIDSLSLQGKKLAEIYHTHGKDKYFTDRMKWANDSSQANIIFTDDPMELSSGLPFDTDTNDNLITFKERQKLLQGETVVLIREHPKFHQDILGIAIPVFSSNDDLSGTIFLSMPLSDVYEPFVQIRLTLGISILMILLLIFVIGYKSSNKVVQTINKMKEIAMEMESGDFSKRMAVTKKGDELNQLSRSFNKLSSTLEKVEQHRKEFLANVSHELRTPLSYMKGYAEGIEEGIIDQKKGMQIIQDEATRLSRLVHDLLDLAQLEGDSYPLTTEPIVFAQLIHDVLDQMAFFADKKNITLKRTLEEDCIVYGDSDRLQQVIRNLLDNAIQYTPSGKSISIELQVHQSVAELRVTDEGNGIPKEDLPHVSERFYRVNKARTRKDGGSGLGLAIVYQIIKKHHGTFDIQSESGIGTTAIIQLPNASFNESSPTL